MLRTLWHRSNWESIQASGVTLVSVGRLFSSEMHNIASGRESIEPQKSNPVYGNAHATVLSSRHSVLQFHIKLIF